MPIDERSNGWRFALAAYVLWGVSPLFWRLLDDVPLLQLIAHRAVWSFPFLLALVVWWQRTSLRVLLESRRIALVHLVTVLLLAANWLLYLFAISTDRVIDASLGYFINPLVSVLLGVVFLKEKLSPLVTITVVLATVGVGILTWEAGQLPWISLTLAVTFGVYGLMRKLSPLGSLDGLTLEVGWAFPVALGFLVVTAGRGDLDMGNGITPWIVWMVAVVTAVPLLLFAEGARRSPLWLVGILQYLAPTLQFLLGALIFGEEVSAKRMAGFVVIWIALAFFAAGTIRQARLSAAGGRQAKV